MGSNQRPTPPRRPPNPVFGRSAEEAPPPYSIIDPADHDFVAASTHFSTAPLQTMDPPEWSYSRRQQRLAAGRSGGVFQMESDTSGYRTWRYQAAETFTPQSRDAMDLDIHNTDQADDDGTIEEVHKQPPSNPKPTTQPPPSTHNNLKPSTQPPRTNPITTNNIPNTANLPFSTNSRRPHLNPDQTAYLLLTQNPVLETHLKTYLSRIRSRFNDVPEPHELPEPPQLNPPPPPHNHNHNSVLILPPLPLHAPISSPNFITPPPPPPPSSPPGAPLRCRPYHNQPTLPFTTPTSTQVMIPPSHYTLVNPVDHTVYSNLFRTTYSLTNLFSENEDEGVGRMGVEGAETEREANLERVEGEEEEEGSDKVGDAEVERAEGEGDRGDANAEFFGERRKNVSDIC